MYPTLIVVIVASRRSVLERSQASATLTEVTPPRRFRVSRESVGSPRFPARSSCSMTVIGGNDDEKFDVSLGKNRSARSPLAEEVQATV